jgi:hypothetical protein
MTAKKEPGRVDRHAPRIPGQQPTIGLAGRQGWGRMTPAGDVELGRQLRTAAWEVANRTAVRGTRRDALVLATMRNRFGAAAVDRFGPEAITALLRQPGPGACAWDALRVLTATAAPPKPTPDPTPGLRALLGAMCSRCKVHFAAREVADREHAHLDRLAENGLRASAAATLRTDAQVARKAAAVRATEQARRAPAPTGMLWPADQGEPPGLTAAAHAAARRGRRPDGR